MVTQGDGSYKSWRLITIIKYERNDARLVVIPSAFPPRQTHLHAESLPVVCAPVGMKPNSFPIPSSNFSLHSRSYCVLLVKGKCKKSHSSWVWRCTPVIPLLWGAKAAGQQVQAQPEQLRMGSLPSTTTTKKQKRHISEGHLLYHGQKYKGTWSCRCLCVAICPLYARSGPILSCWVSYMAQEGQLQPEKLPCVCHCSWRSRWPHPHPG